MGCHLPPPHSTNPWIKAGVILTAISVALGLSFLIYKVCRSRGYLLINGDGNSNGNGIANENYEGGMNMEMDEMSLPSAPLASEEDSDEYSEIPL